MILRSDNRDQENGLTDFKTKVASVRSDRRWLFIPYKLCAISSNITVRLKC